MRSVGSMSPSKKLSGSSAFGTTFGAARGLRFRPYTILSPIESYPGAWGGACGGDALGRAFALGEENAPAAFPHALAGHPSKITAPLKWLEAKPMGTHGAIAGRFVDSAWTQKRG
jgi:hypothetical protein